MTHTTVNNLPPSFHQKNPASPNKYHKAILNMGSNSPRYSTLKIIPRSAPPTPPPGLSTYVVPRHPDHLIPLCPNTPGGEGDPAASSSTPFVMNKSMYTYMSSTLAFMHRSKHSLWQVCMHAFQQIIMPFLTP